MAISNISLKSIQIPKGKNHTATSYQVASDGLFTDESLVYDIDQDEENLYSKSFDLDYTVNDIYYGRVKLHFDDDTYYGWTKPIVLTKDGDGFSHNNIVIVTPRLTTTTDRNNAELGGFKVDGSEFILFSGVGHHKATSWYLKNTNGDVIWSRERDKNNLTSIRIPNNILEVNNLYIIEAVYYSDSNMKSNTGRLMIKTMGRTILPNPDVCTDDFIKNGECQDLAQAYEDLLNMVVNHLALGGECLQTEEE